MKFLTKNYLEDVTVGNLVASSGNASVGLLKDRNLNSSWVSIGSNDAITETVTATFSAAVTISAISLRNMNLRSYDVMYWTGAAWANFSTAISVAGNTTTSLYHEFNPVSTTSIRLRAYTTIIPNDEKRIGEYMAYYKYIDLLLENLPDKEDPLLYDRKNEHEKVDGGSLIVYEAIKGKYQNTFSWDNLIKTYADQLLSLKNLHISFWVIPYEDNYENQYYVNWVNDYNFQKVLAWSPSGERCYGGDVEVKET